MVWVKTAERIGGKMILFNDMLHHIGDLRRWLIFNEADGDEMLERFRKTFTDVDDNQPKDLAWCKWYQCYADGMQLKGN